MNNRTHRAFTLMEMLLVTVLVSVIGLVVFQALNNGLKLWARGVGLNHEGDVAIMLDKMGEDVRNIVLMGNMEIDGSVMRFSFPSIVLTQADLKGSRASEGFVDQIGQVEYRFDPADGKVFRRQANYGQAFKGQWQPEREIASGLDEVEFRYFIKGIKGLDERSTVESVVPSGVSIKMHLKGDRADRYWKRYFVVPVGG